MVVRTTIEKAAALGLAAEGEEPDAIRSFDTMQTPLDFHIYITQYDLVYKTQHIHGYTCRRMENHKRGCVKGQRVWMVNERTY